jgi:hypothetical protein
VKHNEKITDKVSPTTKMVLNENKIKELKLPQSFAYYGVQQFASKKHQTVVAWLLFY